MRTTVAGNRLIQVVRTVWLLRLVEHLTVPRGFGQVAIHESGSNLLGEDRELGRRADVEVALRIDDDSTVAALGEGVPAGRRGCATLPLRVLRRALGRDT